MNVVKVGAGTDGHQVISRQTIAGPGARDLVNQLKHKNSNILRNIHLLLDKTKALLKLGLTFGIHWDSESL